MEAADPRTYETATRADRGDHPAAGLRRGRPARDARPRPRGPRAWSSSAPPSSTPSGQGLEELRLDELVARLEAGITTDGGRVSTYDLIADLPLEVDDYALEGLERDVSSRVHAPVHRDPPARRRRGGPRRGRHLRRRSTTSRSRTPDRRCRWPAAGRIARRSPSHLGGARPVPGGARVAATSRALYRRWAFESAALDLALRQAGTPLHEVLGREPRPVTFVVSLRLGEPATLEPMHAAAGALPDAALQARPHARAGRTS